MVREYPRNKRLLISALGVAVIVVALWFVLFGTGSLISREKVEARLQDISAQLGREAQAGGKEAKLTHGQIDMEGWGYSKRALVRNVTAEISEKTVEGAPPHKLAFSSDNLIVSLDPSNTHRLLFEIPTAVTISENDQPRTVVTLSESLRYAYMDGQADGVMTHEMYLPGSITLAPAGAAEGAKDQMVISFQQQPIIKVSLSADQKTRSVDYTFSGIGVTGADGNQLSIGEVASHFEEAPSAESRISGKYELSVKNILAGSGEAVAKPYNIHIDFTFEGDEKAQVALTDLMPRVTNADVVLNEAQLASESFKLTATGKLSARPEDPLMFGDINLAIDNIPAFLTSEIVPLQVRGAVEAALEKVSGQKISGLTQLSIPLKREKNGVFYVGQVTFEGLATSFFADMLSARPPETVVLGPEPGAAPSVHIPPAPAMDPATAAPAAGVQPSALPADQVQVPALSPPAVALPAPPVMSIDPAQPPIPAVPAQP